MRNPNTARTLCFLDVETTGHDPLRRVADALVPWHEIIDIGIVFADSQSLDIYAETEAKVKPEHPERCLPNLVNDYQIRAAQGEWNDAGSLPDVLNGLLNLCGRFEVIPIGQNFFFDWSFLSVAFAWCGIEEAEWRKHMHYSRLDTRSMAVQELQDPNQGYDPDQYSLRNEFLSKRLGIPPEPYPHKASNGAMQSYLVYSKLRELKMERLNPEGGMFCVEI